jgi:hypothetical protein
MVDNRAIEKNGAAVLLLQISIGFRGLEELLVVFTSFLEGFARSRPIAPVDRRGDRQDQEKTYTERPMSTHPLL